MTTQNIWEKEDRVYSRPEPEVAKLQLAFLKENIEFQKFYHEMKSSWHQAKLVLILQVLYALSLLGYLPNQQATAALFIRLFGWNDKNSMVGQEFRKDGETNHGYEHRIHMMTVKGTPFWGGKGQQFGLYDQFITLVQSDGNVSTDEVLDLLDPENDNLEKCSSHLKEILPNLFMSSSISEVGRCRGLVESPDGELKYRRYDYQINIDDLNLRPEERVVKIDLSKNIGQIRTEFDFFIRRERRNQKVREGLSAKLQEENSNYDLPITWRVQDKRNQIEAWEKQLRVWRLRRNRKSFQEIAYLVSEPVDTVKKRFYSAFEKITGEKYSRDIWKKLFFRILENRLSNEGKFEKDTWEIMAKQLETGRSESFEHEVESWEVTNAQLELNLLKSDIKKICSSCNDKECHEKMTQALNTDDYGDWSACPEVYNFLNDKSAE